MTVFDFMLNSRGMSNSLTFENKYIPIVESSVQASHIMRLSLMTVNFQHLKE